MRGKSSIDIIVLGVLTGVTLVISLLPRVVWAQAPHPIGTPLATVISFGDEYTSSVELYDATITVLEVVRGPGALELARKAAGSVPAPKSGFEYLLVRIRFEFSARGAPGDKTYRLTESLFSAFSPAGMEHPRAELTKLEPELSGTLRSGDSLEGWVGFVVAQEDRRPVLNFVEDVQSVLRGGTGIRFKLY